MTILILASASDETAIGVARLLVLRRGRDRVQLRAPTELVLAPHWEHRLSEAETTTRVTVHDGASLGEPAVIFNRLHDLEGAALKRGALEDRHYADAEMSALLLSWLSGVDCPVVNPPLAAGFLVCRKRPIEWMRLAEAAGLRAADTYVTTSERRFPAPRSMTPAPYLSWRSARGSDEFRVNGFGWRIDAHLHGQVTVDVVGDHAFGPASRTVLASCVKLARLSRLPVLRVRLSTTAAAPERLLFVGADACPAIEDPDTLSAVADLLDRLASSCPERAAGS